VDKAKDQMTSIADRVFDSTARNQTESLLLRLPPEIRNTIYTYILGGRRVSLDESGRLPNQVVATIKGAENEKLIGEVLNITMACRQTHSESIILFFALNEFGGKDLGRASGFARFVDGITEQQQAVITHVWLDFCCAECLRPGEVSLQRLRGLQNITIVKSDLSWDLTESIEEEINEFICELVGKTVDVVFEDRNKADPTQEMSEQEESTEEDDSEEDDSEEDDSEEDDSEEDDSEEDDSEEDDSEEDDSEEEGLSEEEHEDGVDVATDKPRDDEDAKFSKREEEE
jgi:hypothetical protein